MLHRLQLMNVSVQRITINHQQNISSQEEMRVNRKTTTQLFALDISSTQVNLFSGLSYKTIYFVFIIYITTVRLYFLSNRIQSLLVKLKLPKLTHRLVGGTKYVIITNQLSKHLMISFYTLIVIRLINLQYHDNYYIFAKLFPNFWNKS